MRDASHPALRLKPFVAYKSVNAFFQGVWGTAYVALMAPLPPEAFSAGPLAFSVGPLLVALAYSRLLNLRWFFRISVSVEVIALLSVVAVLLYPQSFLLAAGVYLGFQLALIFLRLLGPDKAGLRAPTIALDIKQNPKDVTNKLAQKGIMAGSGDFYAVRALEAHDIDTSKGVLRLSYVHYTNREEIEKLVDALDCSI